MAYRYEGALRALAVGVAGLMLVSSQALAQGANDPTSLRDEIQSAVNRAEASAASLSPEETRRAVRAAVEAVITRSGATPQTVQAALSLVRCEGAPTDPTLGDRERNRSCVAALNAVRLQVAEAEQGGLTDIGAVGPVVVAAPAAINAAPAVAGGGGGGSPNYTTGS